MAQAALRIADDEIDTSIVRRLMARPLHVVPATDATYGVQHQVARCAAGSGIHGG